jgi:hypothetical protein
VKDQSKVSSYVSKYITKVLAAVTKYRKRYWHSRNLNVLDVESYNVLADRIDEIFGSICERLKHTKVVVCKPANRRITYIEVDGCEPLACLEGLAIAGG